MARLPSQERSDLLTYHWSCPKTCITCWRRFHFTWSYLTFSLCCQVSEPLLSLPKSMVVSMSRRWRPANSSQQLAKWQDDRWIEQPTGQGTFIYGGNRRQWCGRVDSLFGGTFFIGIFLSLIFMVGTVIVIYYKQISEGYEDRDRFVILQT